MPAKKYKVKLTANEKLQLKEMVFKGKVAAYKRIHAQILLSADQSSDGPGCKDADIANSLHIGTATVERVRRRFVEEGLEAALERRPQEKRREKKLDGEQEAFLIATACSQAPEGRQSWTLRLLVDHLIDNKIVETISHETVRQALKKTTLSPG